MHNGMRTFKKTPKHYWSSHAADAFRNLSMASREPRQAEDERPDPIKELLKPKTLTKCGKSTRSSGLMRVLTLRNGFNFNKEKK